MSIIDNLEVHDVESFFTPFEVDSAGLGRILGVTATTVSKWAQDGRIPAKRETTIGGGRPRRIFDLHDVHFALDAAGEAYAHYLPRLAREIDRRETEVEAVPAEPPLQQALREVQEARIEITERDVLLDRISRLERLVLRVVKGADQAVYLDEADTVEVLNIALAYLPEDEV